MSSQEELFDQALHRWSREGVQNFFYVRPEEVRAPLVKMFGTSYPLAQIMAALFEYDDVLKLTLPTEDDQMEFLTALGFVCRVKGGAIFTPPERDDA